MKILMKILMKIRVCFFKGNFRIKHCMRIRKNLKNTPIKIRELCKEDKKRIMLFWKKYNIKPDMKAYQWFYSVNGICDPRYIPHDVFAKYIIPITNNNYACRGANDKNLFYILFPKENMPEALLHNVNGVLLNESFEVITEQEALKIVEGEDKIVIKPSVDTFRGNRVCCIESKDLLEQMRVYKENYVVQRVLKQHALFAKMNESSVNVIRMTTYLDSSGVHVIDTILRVGREGEFTDHLNIAIGVDSEGRMKSSGVFTDGRSVTTLPNGFAFANKEIPAYKDMCTLVKKMHPRIGAALIVGWDLAVNEQGEVIIVEANLQFPGIMRSQECNGPLFGDMTDSFLDKILNVREQ